MKSVSSKSIDSENKEIGKGARRIGPLFAHSEKLRFQYFTCVATVAILTAKTFYGQNNDGQAVGGAVPSQTSRATSQNSGVRAGQSAPANPSAAGGTIANQSGVNNQIQFGSQSNGFRTNGFSFSNQFGFRTNRVIVFPATI